MSRFAPPTPPDGTFATPRRKQPRDPSLPAAAGPTQRVERSQAGRPLPAGLRHDLEDASGHDMSDVRVHRNSVHPAQLRASAYAQGDQIYLGPGGEQHLPHEAWHVVQQKQGRVQAKVQAEGAGINQDAALEREASTWAMPAPFGYRPSLHSPLVPDAAPIQRMRPGPDDNDQTFDVIDVNGRERVGRFVYEPAPPPGEGYLFSSGSGQFRVMEDDILRPHDPTGGLSLPKRPRSESGSGHPPAKRQRTKTNAGRSRARADKAATFVEGNEAMQGLQDRLAPRDAGTMELDADRPNLRGSRAAFLVEIPIRADKDAAQQIIDIVAAYEQGEGADEQEGKEESKTEDKPLVAFLFCLNARTAIDPEVLAACQQAIAGQAQPIGLLTYVWSGTNFPYGTVRNALLASPAARDLLAGFRMAGYRPYVAVGDADTGARMTPGGVNIFSEVERQLRPDPERLSRTEPLFEPFLVGGGYRPVDDPNRPRHRLVMDEDMGARDIQSRRVNPLGPYFPEPNLFISGSMLLDDPNVRFGPKGAEFSELRTSVVDHIERDLAAKVPSEEQRKIHRQTNTHPTRDTMVMTGFSDLSVETDTQRLVTNKKKVTNWEQSNPNVVKQHHQGTNTAKSTYMSSRYGKDEDEKDSGLFLAMANMVDPDVPLSAIILEMAVMATIRQGRARTPADPSLSQGNAIGPSILASAFPALVGADNADARTAMLAAIWRYQELILATLGSAARTVPAHDRILPTNPGGHSNRTAPVLTSDEAILMDVFQAVISTLSSKQRASIDTMKRKLGDPAATEEITGELEELTPTASRKRKRIISFDPESEDESDGDDEDEMLDSSGTSVEPRPVWGRRRTERNGDCLYQAINLCLGNDADMDQVLREMVTQYAADHRDLIAEAGLDANAVLATLSQQGSWAGDEGDLAPAVLASAISRNILVVADDYVTLIESAEPPQGETITVFLSNDHYDVVPQRQQRKPTKKIQLPKKD